MSPVATRSSPIFKSLSGAGDFDNAEDVSSTSSQRFEDPDAKRYKRSSSVALVVLSDSEDDEVKRQKCLDVGFLDRLEPLHDGDFEPDERWEPPSSGNGGDRPSMDWIVVSQKPAESNAVVPYVGPVQAYEPGDDEEFDLLLLPAPEENEEEISDEEAAERVNNLLQAFERIRLRIIRDADVAGRKRGNAANQAGQLLNGRYVNRKKRVGHVPGVEVGRVFCFRFEMLIVGLHQQTMSGIAYMNQYGVQVATSLVLSGGYEDDVDEGETFIYIGQGQNEKGRQIGDQKLEKGNLALANSCELNLPVRVIRGLQDANSPSGKIYSYDGLYRIKRYWSETGVSGFLVYKYYLEREPGQRELGSRLVRFADKIKSKKERRSNVVCEDISGGLERVPICAVNDVDKPPVPPSGYTYITQLKYPAWYEKPSLPSGCKCKGHCGEDGSCKCVRKNGGHLPYNRDGNLLEWRTIVYECGPRCRCPPTCPNKVTQRERKLKFEVFKTRDRGWGVRSLDSIAFGSFICEYVGEMIDNEEAERRVGNDEYIFDVDCIQGSRNRGMDISGFFEEEEEAEGQLCERVEEGMSIDASSCGNFTRFINHSCDPNIFVQCLFYDHNDMKVPHIMMFASRHIRPFEELAYDYGYQINSVTDPVTGKIKQKACYCGAKNCRKRLY